MYQREGFEALQEVLSRATQLLHLVRIKEIYMTNKTDEGEVWHIQVDNDVFEAITDKSMQEVYAPDNEEDGPIVQRVSLQTANHIKLFTVYELTNTTKEIDTP